MIEKDTMSDGIQKMNLSTIASECNNVGNLREWWVDTGSTRHVCADKTIFSNYEELNGEQVFMETLQVLKLKDEGKLLRK